MKNIRDNITQTKTQNSIFGENMSVVKNVIYHITASCFSIFHALCKGENWIIFITASIIIPARVATGRYDSTGVKNSRVIQTIAHVTTDVSQVRAQAFKLTAVLLKLPATQYPQNKLELILASHWPISSLFGLNGFLVAYETYLATEIDCVKPMSQITMENINKRRMSWKLAHEILIYTKSSEITGRLLGIFPTINQLYSDQYPNK